MKVLLVNWLKWNEFQIHGWIPNCYWNSQRGSHSSVEMLDFHYAANPTHPMLCQRAFKITVSWAYSTYGREGCSLRNVPLKSPSTWLCFMALWILTWTLWLTNTHLLDMQKWETQLDQAAQQLKACTSRPQVKSKGRVSQLALWQLND